MPYREEVSRLQFRSERGASKPAWLIGAALLALPVLWLVLGHSDDPRAPDELHGTWTTDAADYADRAFTITDSTVTFHQGGEDSTVHRLVGLEREADGDGSEYMLEYEHDGHTLKLGFEFSDAAEIRIRNQEEMVWSRDS